MGSLVKDINTHIEAQVALSIPTFAKASFIYDSSKDKRKGASARYAVRPLSAGENDLNIGSYAVDHLFEVTLTEVFKSSRSLNDYDMADKVLVLQDYCHDIFKQVQSTIGTVQIRQVFSLTIEEPEINEEDNIIAQKMTLTIKYQNTLK